MLIALNQKYLVIAVTLVVFSHHTLIIVTQIALSMTSILDCAAANKIVHTLEKG